MGVVVFPEQKKVYLAAQLSAAAQDLGPRADEKVYLLNRPRRFYSGG